MFMTDLTAMNCSGTPKVNRMLSEESYVREAQMKSEGILRHLLSLVSKKD